MRRLEIPATPHGIRRSFAEWAAERPEIAATIVNEVLALNPRPSTTLSKFLANKLFPERRRVMRMWADCLTETMGPVVPQ